MLHFLRATANLFGLTKEAQRERGYQWAKQEIAKGESEEFIESYIYGSSDPFDLGAAEYLREGRLTSVTRHF